ncbi:MAG: hypothetical protein PHC34_12710 [Candidatus Gastranaerophilales bacterium]|nr:hypothetical protein [Candidatus Gastranaerophilales bacterium]
MDSISVKPQVETLDNKNDKKNKIAVNSGIGLLGGGVIAGFASRIKQPPEDLVLLKMKEDDSVKQYIEEEVLKIKNQASNNLLDKFNSEINCLSEIFAKKLKKEALSENEIENLKKLSLPENISLDEIINQTEIRLKEMETLTNPDINELVSKNICKSFKLNGAVSLEKLKEAYNNIFNYGKKALEGNASQEELKVLNEYLFLPDEQKSAKTIEEFKSELCKTFELDPATTTVNDLEQAVVREIKEMLKFDNPDEITSIDSFNQYLKEKTRTVLTEYTKLQTGVESNVKAVADTLNVDEKKILSTEKFSELKDNTVKALKNKKLLPWILIGSAIGGVVTGTITYLSSKSQK